jgi:hypothetical protein
MKIMDAKFNQSIKSKQRSVNFGEVNTSEEIINSMLDMVKDNCNRPESRFLEPACGDGNFLCIILKRKLEIILDKTSVQEDFEKNSLLACSSLYGIDLLNDNIKDAQERLLNIFLDFYSKKFPNKKQTVIDSFKFILSKNIVQGDAVNFKKGDSLKEFIVLPEWSLIKNSFKRRDFAYKDFISYQPMDGDNLFSDLGDEAFIPEPVKEYPLIKYNEVYKLES